MICREDICISSQRSPVLYHALVGLLIPGNQVLPRVEPFCRQAGLPGQLVAEVPVPQQGQDTRCEGLAVIIGDDPTVNPVLIPAGADANDPAGEMGTGEPVGIFETVSAMPPIVKMAGGLVGVLILLKILR